MGKNTSIIIPIDSEFKLKVVMFIKDKKEFPTMASYVRHLLECGLNDKVVTPEKEVYLKIGEMVYMGLGGKGYKVPDWLKGKARELLK